MPTDEVLNAVEMLATSTDEHPDEIIEQVLGADMENISEARYNQLSHAIEAARYGHQYAMEEGNA